MARFNQMHIPVALLLMMGAAPQALRAEHVYKQTNLVSDIAGLATQTDPNLVNPWGLARSGTSPWWVSDNGTGLSTLYNGAGAIQSLVVTIAVPSGATEHAAPTGVVFNGTTGFQLPSGQTARFIFVTEGGTLSGWGG